MSEQYRIWVRRKQMVEDIRALAIKLRWDYGLDCERWQRVAALAAEEEIKTANEFNCNRRE